MYIRPYRPEELPALREILVEAFNGVSIDQGMEREFGHINGHDWQWRKDRHLDLDVARDPGGIFVIELDGRIAGFISTWMDREAGIGYIPNLVFVPECRGRGLGRRAIEFALDRFREAGLSHAKIETLVQNEVGTHLYTSIGFREVARQIHFAGSLDEMARIHAARQQSNPA
jgi:ribosomal protein S18 acetylase RimI-like enzyme